MNEGVAEELVMEKLYFEVISILNKRIRVTEAYWNYIVNIKHPSIKGLEEYVKVALKKPVKVIKSLRDETIFLYYGEFKDKFICVVVKHLNTEGFIVTVYLTRRMVSGEVIWRRR